MFKGLYFDEHYHQFQEFHFILINKFYFYIGLYNVGNYDNKSRYAGASKTKLCWLPAETRVQW